MHMRGTDTSHFPALFSDESPANGLSRAASHAASAFPPSGLIESYPKATLAAFFFGLTNYVLFEDVLRHGAEITTDHLLSFGVLVGAVAAGHYCIPAFRSWKLLQGLGLLILFGVGTYYCVLASAVRNAEHAAKRATEVAEADAPRRSLAVKVASASAEKARTEKALTEAQGITKALTDKQTEACADGPGPLCRGAKENVAGATERETARRTEYKAALAAHTALKAQLDAIPVKDPNRDLKFAAKLHEYVGLIVPATVLADLMPVFKAVFCELATLVFASGAFGHRRETVLLRPIKSVASGETVPPTGGTRPDRTAGPKDRPTVPRDRPTAQIIRLGTVSSSRQTIQSARDRALNLLRQRLASDGTIAQSDLQALFGDVSKQTISRWCDEWENAAIIVRTIVGRSKTVALAESKRVSRRGS